MCDITTHQLCERFHFQEDYFNRILKQKAGMTFTEYVQDIRIREAERLLATTEMTIQDIAQEVGYHNKGYFYKLFTKCHQVTPAEFRKRHLL